MDVHRAALAWAITLALWVAPQSGYADYATARAQFKSALSAVEAGDPLRVAALTSALGDYPLVDYLHYRWLSRQLDAGEPLDTQVRDFMTYYPGRYAERLRGAWVARLAEEQRWRRLLVVVRPEASDTQLCRAYQARFALGERPAWEPRLAELWSRVRRPGACEPVFEALEKASPPDAIRVWRRLITVMDKGHIGTAGKLKKYLDADGAATVSAWVSAHRDPRQALAAPPSRAPADIARRIFVHAIERLAQEDAAAARAQWLQRRAAFRLDFGTLARVDRYIGVRAALQRHAQAYAWLQDLAPAARNAQAHAWRTRAALHRADWYEVAQSIRDMPAELRAGERWRYWLARARRQLGDTAAADEAFAELAERTDYYGFLAADQLGRAYRFNELATVVDDTAFEQLRKEPLLIRAREFLAVDLPVEARREWERLLRGLDRHGQLAAAVIADGWGWHDRAVYTIARTGQRRDYALRFPMPYTDKVLAAAQTFALEPALIYGVLRRESAYREDARSRAGALGLMQLMPATARRVAGRLGSKASTGDLLRADVNIRFGSKYFRDMLDRFGNHQVLAAAAYNAGPHRVQKWLPAQGSISADIWVDTLPFKETRNYVRAVLAYTTIFEWRGGSPVARLRQRMPDIVAP